jgi:hypothetical protein
MDIAREQVIREVRHCLTQIALELEAAAEGARGAAEHLADRSAAWSHVQQMYGRLEEASHLVGKFQRTINEAMEQTG